jgi:hypothetical protein
MKIIVKLAVSAAFVWWLYSRYTADVGVQTEQPLPPGAKATGRVSMTTGGGPPGEDVSGFDPKAFAEVLLPTGEKLWVEIKQKLASVFAPAADKGVA